jgi:hypothetical protein
VVDATTVSAAGRKRRDPTWREFEKLVERIERVAGPVGTVVRSPDKLRSLTTGRSREVDVSIRHKIGTAEILIAVECRDRSMKGDVRWIEELRSKRDSLGISKTIAVSKRGFSRDAVETARLYGIELRTLSEITPGEINGWILPGKITYSHQNFDIHAVSIDVDDAEEQGVIEQVPDSIFQRTTAQVFATVDGRRWCLNDLIRAALMQEPALTADVPADGTRIRRTLRLSFKQRDLSLRTDTGGVGVIGIAVDVDFWKKEQSREGNRGSYHKYLDAERRSVQRAEFTVTVGLSTLRLGVQHASQDEGVRLSVELNEDSVAGSETAPSARPHDETGK